MDKSSKGFVILSAGPAGLRKLWPSNGSGLGGEDHEAGRLRAADPSWELQLCRTGSFL